MTIKIKRHLIAVRNMEQTSFGMDVVRECSISGELNGVQHTFARLEHTSRTARTCRERIAQIVSVED